MNLAIIITHPIQYHSPVFRMLAQRNYTRIKVFYTWGEAVVANKFDPGFGSNIDWDIPLLEGYDHCFVKNIASDPGSHHFWGIDNPGLIHLIEEWGATALLVFGWSFKSHLKLLRHFKGKKMILFRGDSTLLDEAPGFSVKKTLRKIFLQWVYGHIDKALYVGTDNKQYYLAFGLKEEQLVFAPHAIDNERFMQEVAGISRESLGIPPGAIVFIFAGKFETKKDPLLLLDTFLRLDDADAHLVLAGSGELEASLINKAGHATDTLQRRIHILPFQNQLQMPAVYRLGNVLVLPSKGPGETWGLAVNEAMACGLAILVSDKCGCATDLVEEGGNGHILKSGDGNDLLQKMKSMLSDPGRTALMGRRSVEIIQAWNFEKICVAIEGCLFKVDG